MHPPTRTPDRALHIVRIAVAVAALAVSGSAFAEQHKQPPRKPAQRPPVILDDRSIYYPPPVPHERNYYGPPPGIQPPMERVPLPPPLAQPPIR